MDALDPEALKLLQSVLDEAWASLSPDERAKTSKTLVASRLLAAAAAGERDPARLRIEAIAAVATSAAL
jgi:hypothetical protein